MVRIREARRAYRRFHATSFGSYKPDLEIGPDDIEWVAETLKEGLSRVSARATYPLGA